jgi:hypothetical protein
LLSNKGILVRGDIEALRRSMIAPPKGGFPEEYLDQGNSSKSSISSSSFSPRGVTQDAYLAGLARKLERLGGEHSTGTSSSTSTSTSTSISSTSTNSSNNNAQLFSSISPVAHTEGRFLARGSAEELRRLAESTIEYEHRNRHRDDDDGYRQAAEAFDDVDDGAGSLLGGGGEASEGYRDGGHQRATRRYEYIEGPNSSDDDDDDDDDDDKDQGSDVDDDSRRRGGGSAGRDMLRNFRVLADDIEEDNENAPDSLLATYERRRGKGCCERCTPQ